MKLAIQAHKKIFGERPQGWYTGRCSPNTRDLVFEDGGFLYDSDSYSDDLPYWEVRNKKKQLIIPYTLDNNDMRFATNQGFNTGDHFFTYLKDSFDALYEEGKTNPKMMSVGLHCRLIGKPGRIQSLKKFLDYIMKHEDVWICKRIDIAKHWIKNYSNIMSKKIIFTNGLIDLAQPRLGSKVIFKTDDFFASANRIINPLPAFLKKVFLIKMVNGWMDGNLEEKEIKA